MNTPELGQMVFGNKWEDHEAPDWIARDLYSLSELIGAVHPESNERAGGGGYGHDVDNAIFEMHAYWWGDCQCGFEDAEEQWEDDNQHADDCYQSELDRRGGIKAAATLAAEWHLSRTGCAVHCTCGQQERWAAWRAAHDHDPRCPVVLPNFLHKPSGLAVHWYKYIGRGMTVNRDVSLLEWARIYDECRSAVQEAAAS